LKNGFTGVANLLALILLVQHMADKLNFNSFIYKDLKIKSSKTYDRGSEDNRRKYESKIFALLK
jgi:hypothetical protein